MMMSWYVIDKDLQGEDEDEASAKFSWSVSYSLSRIKLQHDPEWVTEPIDSAGKCL